MKNLKYALLLLLVFGCTKDMDFVGPMSLVPENLKIEEPVGLKLESIFTTNQVSINVKLPEDGTYRLKIRNIDNTLISQERLSAREGDNLLSIYTKNLDKSSYTVELTTDNHSVLGRAVFVNQ